MISMGAQTRGLEKGHATLGELFDNEFFLKSVGTYEERMMINTQS